MSASSKIRKLRTVIGNFVLPTPRKAKKVKPVATKNLDPAIKEIRRSLKTLSENVRRPVVVSDNRNLDLIVGSLLARQVSGLGPLKRLREAEFRIFSQWGDDGIIQWLLSVLEFKNEVFVEFGVENYREANTKFLLINNNWSGLVMDGSRTNIDTIVGSDYFWKHKLKATCAFIDRDNVNELIEAAGIKGDIGILHIDLDGNDYWIWEALTVVNPVVVIMEYNSVFGAERAITVPYDPEFMRTQKHCSNLYFGASLRALDLLASRRGYTFIGSNSNGNNAYFVKNEFMNQDMPDVKVEDDYVTSLFRESRNELGELTYLDGNDRYELIKGLPVWNVESGAMEEL